MYPRTDHISKSKRPSLPRLRSETSGTVSRFANSEAGSLTIFSVYVLVIILMVAGIGIDLMRVERDRSRLQYTLDRAVLAAADLEQPLEPRAVVDDYFTKSGLSQYLKSVVVSEGLGFRSVSATALAEVPTQFMHMNGVDSLAAPAAGTAEERIDGVEISLVLDVSGSMNRNSRLTNLKVAAKDFVDEMVDNTVDGKLSISIIPYATQVSVSDAMMSNFNVAGENDYSNCINFQASHFQETGISTTEELDRTMHFDPWTRSSDQRDDDPVKTVLVPVCEDDPKREILALQKNRTVLKNFIDNLWAGGNTSIDVGMKWGTALLDPDLRPVVNNLIAAGEADASFAARPTGFTSNDALKIVVLMTDGQNTSQYYIDDNYRSGDSYVFWNDEAERYSILNPNSGLYYWPHTGKWYDYAYGEETDNGCEHAWGNAYGCGKHDDPGDPVRLTFAELWAYTPMQTNVRNNYSWDGNGWNNWYYSPRRSVNSSTKNNRAFDICDAAKDEDIIVFTIGFEAPSAGKYVLRNCASSDSHYYDVKGLEISEAFASIASSIRKLRLTQ
ncbi:pilus assembly protein TadG-related protein [Arenibacterium sp. CAU 1754]